MIEKIDLRVGVIIGLAVIVLVLGVIDSSHDHHRGADEHEHANHQMTQMNH